MIGFEVEHYRVRLPFVGCVSKEVDKISRQSSMEDKRNLEKCSYVFRGNFVHSTWKSAMEILQDKIVGISPAGKVCVHC